MQSFGSILRFLSRLKRLPFIVIIILVISFFAIVIATVGIYHEATTFTSSSSMSCQETGCSTTLSTTTNVGSTTSMLTSVPVVQTTTEISTLISTQGVSTTAGILFSATETQLDNLQSYFTSRWNPSVGLIAVGTNTTASGGVTFYLNNGTAAPIFPPWQRYLPFENWKDAAAFAGLDSNTEIASTIFQSIEKLKTSVGWHPSWNGESMIGYIIPYSKANTNIAFTTPEGKCLVMPDSGLPYQIDQAAPWNAATQSWIPPDTTVQDAIGLKINAIDGTMFQAVNLEIRGDHKDAMANLQAVANIAVKNPDGSVGFGSPPFRGMYLGTFLESVEIIGVPTLPAGITFSDIVNTLFGIQQSDGGIARRYSTFTSGVLGSDDETTNAALLAFSPGVIQHIRSEASSGTFNLESVPSANPSIGI